MPTPSAPDHPAPYAFSTCPDTEDSTASRNDTNPADMTLDSIQDSSVAEDDAASRPTTRSPASRYGATDGPLPDLDPDASPDASPGASSPAADNPPYPEPHKNSEVGRERTESPAGDQYPVEDTRHAVGISHLSARRSQPDTPYGSDSQPGYAMELDYTLPSMGSGYPNRRVIPSSPSSFLRAGTRFTGTQQSERQVYDVQVEIKYVDIRESFLCGYLRIQGLTDDHPTLTTYFEGEIIGSKYGFMTKHDSWGANDKTDLSHWSKFPAFRPYSKQAKKGSSVVIKDIAQSEHIFMRWKEHFLVPDHRVRTITGASFEGFYYICFNQVLGEVNGIYFHSKSERFQQLELKHVEDRGCLTALEFR